MHRSIPYIAVVDLALFLVSWLLRVLQPSFLKPVLGAVTSLYWLGAGVGLVLAVYGFIVLGRVLNGRSELLSRAVTTVLFAMVPACTLLIFVLSHLGGRHAA